MSLAELICPAGTPAALRTAVDAGADAVYCGFQDATNARNFPGLNFTIDELAEAVLYAHARGAKVLLALNTYPPAGKVDLWRQAADTGARLGVDVAALEQHVADAHHDGALDLANVNGRIERLARVKSDVKTEQCYLAGSDV